MNIATPTVARGRYGYAVRTGDEELIADAKRDLTAANLAVLVKKLVDDSPPLTDEQVQGISALLRRDGDDHRTGGDPG